MKSLTSLKMGHVGSKTRLLGQILEKPCVCSTNHILSRIFMKLDEDLCLDEISNELEKWSCCSKTRSLGQILEKPCVHCRGQIVSPIIIRLVQNVCLDEISEESQNGSCQFKS